MKNVSNRYQELDALRGIAAIMVVLFHFTMGRPEANFGFKYGTTGVDLFFLISGFVIFMSLSKIKTSRDFIINRVSRLYPTYWACVSLTFLFVIGNSLHTHKAIPFIQYVGNMTMFQFYLRVPSIDTSYWTMIIEMIFYIGILLFFHFKLLRYLKLVGLTFSVFVALQASFFHNILINEIIYNIPLLEFIPLFFAGTIFYKIYTERINLFENYAIIAACWICQISLFDYCKAKYFISQGEYGLMLTLYFLLFILFVNGKLRIIISRPCLFLGKISFALYLIHQEISNVYIIPFLVNNLKLNFWIASCLISLPIVIGLATIITFYIEIPLGKKMKEKLRAIRKR